MAGQRTRNGWGIPLATLGVTLALTLTLMPGTNKWGKPEGTPGNLRSNPSANPNPNAWDKYQRAKPEGWVPRNYLVTLALTLTLMPGTNTLGQARGVGPQELS